MIPTNLRAVEVTHDDIPVLEEIEFGIADPRKMMQVGARQYSHADRATVQELACNAWDAHVAAGINRPIEVTLPSLLQTKFICQDFGIGMSLEDFRYVYTQFGYSTKEHTNDQTGYLGLGSKAPLAYTETFNVVSIKDGMRVEAIVERRPDWSIVFKVVSYHKTNEHSGTQISVEVHNAEEFTQKANDLFRFWEPGRVLVNGQEPMHDVGEEIAKGLYRSTTSQSYVVMGNVPYRIINSNALFYNTRINPMNFVAKVEMGDGVDFTPSREDLEYTPRTTARLTRIITEFEQKILDRAKSDIDAAQTHSEAYIAWNKWNKMLGHNLFKELSFKGDKLINVFPVSAYKWDIDGYRGSSYTISEWQVAWSANTLFVTDFPSLSVTSAQKAKVREWLNIKGMESNSVLFMTDSSLSNPWLDPVRFVTWETIKTEVPKTPRGAAGVSGRPPGSWDYITTVGYEEGKSLPATGEVYYVSLRNSKGKNIRLKMNLLKMKSDAAVIIVPQNRMGKFKRENPKVKEFFEYSLTFVVTDGVSLLTEAAKTAMNISYDEARWLKHLDASKINDPEWAAEVEAVKNKDALIKKYVDNLELARSLGVLSKVSTYITSNSSPMLDKYPLLRDTSKYGTLGNRAESTIYINAKYALLEGK